MSTLHCNPNWPSLRCQAGHQLAHVQIGETACIRHVYQPRTFTSQAATVFIGSIIGSINEAMGKIAKQQIQRIKSGEVRLQNPLGLFFCNPTRETEEALTKLEKEFSMRNLSKLSLENRKLIQSLGLNSENLIELLPKITNTVKAFFQTKCGTGGVMIFGMEGIAPNRYLFSKDQKANDIDTWLKEITIEAADFVYRDLGMVPAQDFDAGASALLGSGSSSSDIADQDLKLMSCFQYALHKIDPLTARAFASGKYKHDTDLACCLMENEWRNVENPDTGDLVVYCDPQGKIVHTGIYKENGKVESKPGIMNPTVYEHGLYDVLGIFGTQIYFMRKSSATY